MNPRDARDASGYAHLAAMNVEQAMKRAAKAYVLTVLVDQHDADRLAAAREKLEHAARELRDVATNLHLRSGEIARERRCA